MGADPFADSPAVTEADPFAQAEEPTLPEGEPPVVNAEGERIDPTTGDLVETEEPAQEPEAATEPEEGTAAPQDAPKGAESRPYAVLYQTADRQWAEADLSSLKVDSIETQVLDGRVWLLARNVDHARRAAFVALGRPQDGVTIVVVARASWKPKRVKPKTIPARESLDIS